MAGKGRFCPKCTKNVGGARWGVDEVAIQRAFTDAGLMFPDMHDLMTDTEDFAKRLAPRRTSRLANLMYSYMGSPFGLSRRYYVGTRAEYAKFLLGTKGGGSGYIFPTNHEELELRPFPYSFFSVGDERRFQYAVKGQPRHNKADFLAQAALAAFDWNGLDPLYFPGIASLT